MASGFKINKRGIDQMMKELQREFDKHPIRVPVQAEPPSPYALRRHAGDYRDRPVQSVHHYHGTVVTVNGDRAQVAWGNNVVSQEQGSSAQVAVGFEELAKVLGEVLEKLPAAGLSPDEMTEAEAAAQEMLAEVTADTPDEGKIRHGLQRLKGILAPVAIGAAEGGGAEVAKLLIGLIGAAFS